MSEPLRPPHPTLTLACLGLSAFMQTLDSTIANVALPTIAGNLGVSASISTWAVTSFAVCNAIALPLTGWLVRRFGQVRLFVTATLLFSLASLLCGLAPSMGLLVLARAVQGLVAGPIYPVTQSLLIAVFPPARRSQALALFVMVTMVGPILGPILGGWITDHYTWPWIFLVNVPLGVFAGSVVASQLRGHAEAATAPRMDYIGLAALAIGVGALQIVLDKGNEEDWFQSGFIVAAALVAAVGLAVFLIWTLTAEDPLVDLRLFRRRSFCAGTIAYVCGYAALTGIILLVPQWLQRQLGYTATWAGLATAPMGILPVLLSPSIGRLAGRLDLRLLALPGIVFFAATCFMRAGYNTDVDVAHVALAQLLMGMGTALFFMPVISMLLSELTPAQIPAGSGLSTFLRTLGGSFSASLTNWLWEHRAIHHHARLAERITPYDPATQQWLSGHAPAEWPQLFAQLERQLAQQAYQLSFNEVLWGLGWLFAALSAVVWVAGAPRRASA